MKILNAFKKTREDEKQISVNSIMKELTNHYPSFTEIEQTEIINRVLVNLMSRKKENLLSLIEEARKTRDSIKDLKI